LSDLGCLGLEDELPIAAHYAKPGALARWLTRLADGGCTHVVVELDADAVSSGATDELRSDTVVVTSMASPAVATWGDQDADTMSPAAAAMRVTATLHDAGCLVSGVPSTGTTKLTRHLPRGTQCLTAGLTSDCDVTATPVEAGLFGRVVLASCAGQMLPLTLDPPVVPFVRDALLALAVGARYGVPLHVAARGLEAAGTVPGRVERMDRGQDAAVFLDMPSSAHALAATISSLRRLTSGRLAVMAEESLLERLGGDEFGPVVARHCDACVVVPPAVLDEDAGALEIAAYDQIDRLLGSLRSGDALIVLGDSKAGGRGPRTPEAGRFALATLVDGWFQVAHGLPESSSRRAA
jgi:UDP-N-acetylmuramoyl-L-alanyl-D-glutamate--2,6-diaminopimelate ligase